jgi:cyanophycinase-like exopeptidase
VPTNGTPRWTQQFKGRIMASKKGTVVLMGSGELTATMVEVHKEQLARFGPAPRAVFLDTPAGFQLNVDEISRRAVSYFRRHVQQPLIVASYKSSTLHSPYETEQAFHSLREADYILIGPGSPTYAVRQLRQTPVPDILTQRVMDGGCLVAASAAALTVGRMALPVYEIYKVGHDLHWVEGMNILGPLGFDLVVIPHWNNAEGGTHDTRFCFMGKPRFDELAAMLPQDVSVFGLDEHTACIIDLDGGEARIAGLGRAVLRRDGTEQVFQKGERFSIAVLQGRAAAASETVQRAAPSAEPSAAVPDEPLFWDSVHGLRSAFLEGLERRDARAIVNALLELDRILWQAQVDLENEEFISQGREVLRDLIVLLGPAMEAHPREKTLGFAPLVEELLTLRATREGVRWRLADASQT